MMQQMPPGLGQAGCVGAPWSDMQGRDGGADRRSVRGTASAEARVVKGRTHSGSTEAGSNGSVE